MKLSQLIDYLDRIDSDPEVNFFNTSDGEFMEINRLEYDVLTNKCEITFKNNIPDFIYKEDNHVLQRPEEFNF